MCRCKKIDVGSYDRQTSMKDPFNSRNKKDGWICIDTCLVQEIAELWYLGIKTYECCCGHNKDKGYIMVDEKDFKKMEKLKYKPIKNWNKKSQSKLKCFYPLLNKYDNKKIHREDNRVLHKRF